MGKKITAHEQLRVYIRFNQTRATIMEKLRQDDLNSLDDLVFQLDPTKGCKEAIENHRDWVANRSKFVSAESMFQSITQRPMQLKLLLDSYSKWYEKRLAKGEIEADLVPIFTEHWEILKAVNAEIHITIKLVQDNMQQNLGLFYVRKYLPQINELIAEQYGNVSDLTSSYTQLFKLKTKITEFKSNSNLTLNCNLTLFKISFSIKTTENSDEVESTSRLFCAIDDERAVGTTPIFMIQPSSQFLRGEYLNQHENCIMVCYDSNRELNSENPLFRTRCFQFESEDSLADFEDHVYHFLVDQKDNRNKEQMFPFSQILLSNYPRVKMGPWKIQKSHCNQCWMTGDKVDSPDFLEHIPNSGLLIKRELIGINFDDSFVGTQMSHTLMQLTSDPEEAKSPMANFERTFLYHPLLLAKQADFAKYVKVSTSSPRKPDFMKKLMSIGRKHNNEDLLNSEKWLVLINNKLIVFDKAYNTVPEDKYEIRTCDWGGDEDDEEDEKKDSKTLVLKVPFSRGYKSFKIEPKAIEDLEELKKVVILYFSRGVHVSKSGKHISYY